MNFLRILISFIFPFPSTPMLINSDIHKVLQQTGIYDQMDDLKRDNSLLRSEGDRLRRELKAVKCELEKSMTSSRESSLRSLHVDNQLKSAVRECSHQIEMYAKRERELITMFERMKRENQKLNEFILRKEFILQKHPSIEEINPPATATISPSICSDRLGVDQRHASARHQEEDLRCVATPTSGSGFPERQPELFSPSTILRGLVPEVSDLHSIDA